jgi:hypothetical protein
MAKVCKWKTRFPGDKLGEWGVLPCSFLLQLWFVLISCCWWHHAMVCSSPWCAGSNGYLGWRSTKGASNTIASPRCGPWFVSTPVCSRWLFDPVVSQEKEVMIPHVGESTRWCYKKTRPWYLTLVNRPVVLQEKEDMMPHVGESTRWCHKKKRPRYLRLVNRPGGVARKRVHDTSRWLIDPVVLQEKVDMTPYVGESTRWCFKKKTRWWIDPVVSQEKEATIPHISESIQWCCKEKRPWYLTLVNRPGGVTRKRGHDTSH